MFLSFKFTTYLESNVKILLYSCINHYFSYFSVIREVVLVQFINMYYSRIRWYFHIVLYHVAKFPQSFMNKDGN